MKLWPIFVQTKGRPNCETEKRFTKSTLVTLAVESSEREAYAPQARPILELANNRGLPRARQDVFDHAAAAGFKWFWLLDDDITSFAKKVNQRLQPCSGEEALLGSQRILERIPLLAQGAVDYRQYAWAQRGSVSLDSFCDVCVCFNVALAKTARYDASLQMKEDRDFTMQLLAAGFTTARCTAFAFNAPANGSNAGGLSGDYQQAGEERRKCAALAAKWGPRIVRLVDKKSGRTDAKIAWNCLSSRIASRKLS